jgi:hypothetical protein
LYIGASAAIPRARKSSQCDLTLCHNSTKRFCYGSTNVTRNLTTKIIYGSHGNNYVGIVLEWEYKETTTTWISYISTMPPPLSQIPVYKVLLYIIT